MDHGLAAGLRPDSAPRRGASVAARLVAGALPLLAACTPVAQAPLNPSDTTRAAVQFTSTHLLPEFGIGASVPQSAPGTPSRIEAVTTFPEGAGFDGASANPEALVVVKAADPESGVKGVQLGGRIAAFCSRAWSDPTPARRVDAPVSAVTVGDPLETPATSAQPTERSASVVLRHAEIRALCAGETLTDFEIVLEAVATNGAGLAATATGRVVRPVSLVAHNMHSPALDELGLASSAQNDRLDQWGRYFARQDIVLLSEATRPEWIARLRLSMPDHSVAHFGSVAVLSIWPLTGLSQAATPPVCVTDVDGVVVCGPSAVNSQYTRAFAMTPRGPMDVLALHWQHRPAPVTSHPARVAFARQIVSAQLASDWAVAGGDFNSKSAWIASEDPELIGDGERETAGLRSGFAALAGQSQPEIAVMESAFRDARREVWETDRSRWSHWFPWPVDHVFVRGRVNAVQYSNDQTGAPPGSDHPTIRVMLLRR